MKLQKIYLLVLMSIVLLSCKSPSQQAERIRMEVIYFETREKFHSAKAVLDQFGIPYFTNFRAMRSYGYHLMISDEYANEVRGILKNH